MNLKTELKLWQGQYRTGHAVWEAYVEYLSFSKV